MRTQIAYPDEGRRSAHSPTHHQQVHPCRTVPAPKATPTGALLLPVREEILACREATATPGIVGASPHREITLLQCVVADGAFLADRKRRRWRRRGSAEPAPVALRAYSCQEASSLLASRTCRSASVGPVIVRASRAPAARTPRRPGRHRGLEWWSRARPISASRGETGSIPRRARDGLHRLLLAQIQDKQLFRCGEGALFSGSSVFSSPVVPAGRNCRFGTRAPAPRPGSC
jgi:hypothetical protein